MSTAIRRYIRETEEEEYQRGFTEKQMEAARLRINFLKDYIINKDTYEYKTVQERDWAYIAKREYNYDVLLDSISKGLFGTNLLLSLGIYQSKRMVYWPLLAFPLLTAYFYPQSLIKHNKKLFDMCNVGEQYHLGRIRNAVLEQCNLIQNVQDF